MNFWAKVFGDNALKLIGMIHVPALPGTPKNKLNIKEIVRRVKLETDIYCSSGVDGLLIENMHDVPYLHPKCMGPEIVSVMTRVCHEVRSLVPASIPCGVQVLAAANQEALAVALAAELQFIRCEGFVFSHIADEGFTDSCAAQLLRYRKTLNAEELLIFCDIKKKHSSHAITSDVNIEETAKAAEFFLADGLVVTGVGTGCAVDISDFQRVSSSSNLPVLIGSGVTCDNVHDFRAANGLIVGSYFKKEGRWDGDLEIKKVKKLVSTVADIRNQK